MNPSYFLAGDQSTPPVSVSLADKSLAAGSIVSIACTGGLADAGVGPSGCAGLVGWAVVSPVNDVVYQSRFPSYYIDHADYPAYIEQLIGVFADANGVIVGTPFLIQSTPRKLTVPLGATQIMLGVNDWGTNDNSGALNVSITW